MVVKVDPSQLDQVLANLCVNARDAIDDIGKTTIDTVNRVLDPDHRGSHTGQVAGECVQLTVSDNGRGIDKEIRWHLQTRAVHDPVKP